MLVGLYVAAWPFHLESPGLTAFLISAHILKEITWEAAFFLGIRDC